MIGEDELRQLEGHVGRALAERSRAGLTILGHGEISIVLGWPFDRPRFACKRLPVFGETVRVLRYRDVFDRYLDALRQRGVPVLPSELEWVDRPDGSVAAYVVQPVLPAESRQMSAALVVLDYQPGPDQEWLRDAAHCSRRQSQHGRDDVQSGRATRDDLQILPLDRPESQIVRLLQGASPVEMRHGDGRVAVGATDPASRLQEP